jgi:hypothetical protein
MNLDRLSHNASAIIKMFNHVFKTEDGVDLQKALLYAAGLAGYACHQSVLATKGEFVVIERKDGKRFYMGNAVNHFLLEGEYSVLSFCNGFIAHFSKEECPDAMELVRNAVAAMQTPDYRIWNYCAPDVAYGLVKECWDGIYDNMTAKYCESPEEWPVLFAIVAQNIMAQALEKASASQLYCMALECALYISKMDDDSI